jgi:hypothetical protein
MSTRDLLGDLHAVYSSEKPSLRNVASAVARRCLLPQRLGYAVV